MNEELREAIGKVLFDEMADWRLRNWEDQPKEVKEQWIARAEKVVEVYRDWIGRQSPKVVSWPGRVDVW